MRWLSRRRGRTCVGRPRGAACAPARPPPVRTAHRRAAPRGTAAARRASRHWAGRRTRRGRPRGRAAPPRRRSGAILCEPQLGRARPSAQCKTAHVRRRTCAWQDAGPLGTCERTPASQSLRARAEWPQGTQTCAPRVCKRAPALHNRHARAVRRVAWVALVRALVATRQRRPAILPAAAVRRQPLKVARSRDRGVGAVHRAARGESSQHGDMLQDRTPRARRPRALQTMFLCCIRASFPDAPRCDRLA